MNKVLRWRNPLSEEDISWLDSYLQRTLTPVFPRQNFVQDLQSRLLRESLSPDGLKNLRLVQYMFVTTGVLAGISLLMITGIRVMIGIFWLLGLVRKFSRPS